MLSLIGSGRGAALHLGRSTRLLATRVDLDSSQDEGFWIPFTPNKPFLKSKPRVVTSGKGMYFGTADGRQVLDASAGLWCSAAGMNPKPVGF